MNRNNNKNNLGNLNRHRAQIACLFLFGSWSLSAGAGTEFHPHGVVSGTWMDNISLVGDTDPNRESAYLLQVNPGFTLLEKARRFNGALDYTMQNRFFPQESDRNSTFHQATANFQAELAQDYLFLDGVGSYSQQLIDPRLPTNNGNLFETTNQTDALTTSLTPALRHNFDALHVEASYTRGHVEYKKTVASGLLQNADTETRDALVGSVDDDAVLTWHAHYQSQRAIYKTAQEFRYDQADGELGLLFEKSLRIIGRGGRESDPRLDLGKGGLDSSYWEGGFRWQSSERTNAEAFYGKRFFGNSYNGRLRHEGRYATWNLSYSETPLTQAQESLLQPVAFDPRTQGGFTPGTQDFARATADVFIRKTAEASVHIAGQRTQIDLSVSDYRREYLNSTLGLEHHRAGSLSIIRNLSARTQMIVGGTIDRTNLIGGYQFHENSTRVEFDHQLGDHISITLGAFRRWRTGNLPFIVDWVTLGVTGHY